VLVNKQYKLAPIKWRCCSVVGGTGKVPWTWQKLMVAYHLVYGLGHLQDVTTTECQEGSSG